MHIHNDDPDTGKGINSVTSRRRPDGEPAIVAAGRISTILFSLLLAMPIALGCGHHAKSSRVVQDRSALVAGVNPESAVAAADKHPPGQAQSSSVDIEYSADGFTPETGADIQTDSNEILEPSAKPVQLILDEALELCRVAQLFWEMGELDNAIQALDQAYALIIGISPEDNPKMMRQKEDLRFHISKRILEIYASRHVVVQGQHKAIPITINAHVQHEIDLFTKGGERDFFSRSYRRSGKFRPMIVPMLKEAGLPEFLSWLPLIESGFNPKALSSARALGLWQFIPSTGLKFGLNRDLFIDERMDPVKSTRAAIAYLKELHQIFGDWTTVLAAYNCGEGRVLRIIREQNINYLDNFWDLYERLPRETARYVPRFLATLHVIAHAERYGLDSVEPHPPVEYEIVNLHRSVSLAGIAGRLDVSPALLRELNPELRHDVLPDAPYNLRVIDGKGAPLLAAIHTIPASPPPSGHRIASARTGQSFVNHRVRPGQTLSTIALQYRTSVAAIARANNIRRHDFIVAGRMLRVPVGQRFAAASTPTTATEHVVQRGDSLWIIAKQYGTTTKNIQDLNNLNSTTIQIGQVLKIPGRTGDDTRPEGRIIYLVRAGDSPYSIARRHNVSLDRLLKANRLHRNSTIHPGQKLIIE